jgi:hypothetical protein
MACRFWKRTTLFPGLTLNLSKSGISIPAGPRGAKFTMGPKGKRLTAGIPGTGLSWTKTFMDTETADTSKEKENDHAI